MAESTLGTEISAPTQGVVLLNTLDRGLAGIREFLGNFLAENSLELELNLPGLLDEVEVYREPSGVVHIEAETDQDLFYTLGLVHAHERLWQMDFQRRLVAGRLSEVVGEESLDQDIFLRTLGLYQAAESAYDNLAPEVREVVDTYTDGINAYLNLDLPLPLEFQVLGYAPEAWQPTDTLAIVKLQSLGLSTNLQSELLRGQLLGELTAQGLSAEEAIAQINTIFPLYQGDETILQPEDVAQIPLPTPAIDSQPVSSSALSNFNPLNSTPAISEQWTPDASNSWVISGEHTTTGEPLLANDPHLGFQLPSVWHLIHLESPSFNAIGASLPGTPIVAIGHNEQVSWGLTNAIADVQDTYILAETPDGSGYIYQGEFQPYEVRWETIEVKGGAAIQVPIKESIYGPLISDVVGTEQPLALRWVALDEEDNTIASFLNISQAQNWEQFTSALADINSVSQNVVYADKDGNIGYHLTGNIPIRNLAAGHTGLLPVPGTGEFDWQGYIPFEQLPQIYNPERGYIVTANNRIVPDNYPYLISLESAEPYRATRIRELIEEKIDAQGQLSLADMQDIQLDQVSLLFRDFQPVLSKFQPYVQGEAADWLNQLLHWNGDTQLDSQEATIFQSWYTQLVNILTTALGDDLISSFSLEPLPRFFLSAFEQGTENLVPPLNFTAEEWVQNGAGIFQQVVASFAGSVPAWGELHQAIFEHPVLPLSREIGYGGDRYTVNVGGYELDTSEGFQMKGGVSYRQVVDLQNLENSVFIQPPGQSGRIFSPYVDNLLSPWQQGEYLSMQTEDYPVAVEVSFQPSASEEKTTNTLFGLESLLIPHHDLLASVLHEPNLL